jgi:LysM repeat protein
MGKSIRFWALGFAAIAPLAGRAQNAADLTNLREDINGLTQQVSELRLRVEQLENGSASTRGGKPPADAVTSAQLQAAVADLTLQMQRLRAAAPVVAPAAVPATAPSPAGEAGAAQGRPEGALRHFSEDFPKQGISYVVQKGDTIALIAKKTGAKFQDIVNANQLADPSKIRAGQKLFIPGGK